MVINLSTSHPQTSLSTCVVLDDYRSSLKPVMVEALVCGASYIKGAHVDLNLVVCLPSFPYLFYFFFGLVVCDVSICLSSTLVAEG